MKEKIKLLSVEEFAAVIKGTPGCQRIKALVWGSSACKIELLENCIAGVMCIPDKRQLQGERQIFGFYVTAEELILIGAPEQTQPLRRQVQSLIPAETTGPNTWLYEILNYIIQDDDVFLQKYEERLEGLEEELLDNRQEAFERKILGIRKELLTLQSYYQQLGDVADVIIENRNQMIRSAQTRLFELYSRRIDRLYDNVNRLKEYTMQLRELHQSQIDIRQNEIMKVLTVVTSLIMPLTLITGWYGMNFVHMPELRSPIGYAVVIGLCILVVIIEILIFKKRKWFK